MLSCNKIYLFCHCQFSSQSQLQFNPSQSDVPVGLLMVAVAAPALVGPVVPQLVAHRPQPLVHSQVHHLEATQAITLPAQVLEQLEPQQRQLALQQTSAIHDKLLA